MAEDLAFKKQELRVAAHVLLVSVFLKTATTSIITGSYML
jgi:hypothetical protein